MKNFTNRYMLLYSLGIAAVVAVVLSVVALSLKTRQDANIRNEKMQMLLATIGVECSRDDAANQYPAYFKEELTVSTDGKVVTRYIIATGEFAVKNGDTRAFDIKLKEEQAKENSGGKGEFPVYVYEKDGEQGYVIPTQGNGLWGAVYANIALADDLSTIVGITFSHDSETPGLGAEIAGEAFRNQFVGKQILDGEGTVVSVAVVKHADASDAHQVDAISGGTMTSNGVSDMLLADLKRYQSFITTTRKEARDEQ
jgi:Na+-transporting NADH:ubiquinone oxidoreductase subunit C